MSAERGLALLLTALLGWHTAEKLWSGLLPEMLWACHLATALVVLGLLSARPRAPGAARPDAGRSVAVAAGLFHCGCGLPGWILETLLYGTTWSSAGLHLITPLVGLTVARTYGIPRWFPLFSIGLWLVAQGLGRLVDPALNLNIAWRPYPGVLPEDSPMWWSHLGNLLLVGALSWATRLVLRRLGWPDAPRQGPS